MWDWFTKIDPTAVFLALSGIVGYFIHRRATVTNESILQSVLGALRTKAFDLLGEYGLDAMEYARKELADEVPKALDRIGIKPNAAVNLIVNGVIETVLAELASKLHALEQALSPAPLVDAAQKVADAFTPPSSSSVPSLADVATFERIDPDAPAAAQAPAPAAAAPAVDAPK